MDSAVAEIPVAVKEVGEVPVAVRESPEMPAPVREFQPPQPLTPDIEVIKGADGSFKQVRYNRDPARPSGVGTNIIETKPISAEEYATLAPKIASDWKALRSQQSASRPIAPAPQEHGVIAGVGNALARGVGHVMNAAENYGDYVNASHGIPPASEVSKIVPDMRNTARQIEAAHPASPSVESGGAFQPTNWRWYTERGTEMVPMLAAQLGLLAATKGQSAGTQFAAFSAPMAVQAAGDTYANARARGADDSTAQNEATLNGVAALALQKFNLGPLLSNSTTKKFFQNAITNRIAQIGTKAGAEGGVNAITSVAQAAADDTTRFVMENDPAAYKDWQSRYAGATAQGLTTGAAMGGSHAILDRPAYSEHVRAIMKQNPGIGIDDAHALAVEITRTTNDENQGQRNPPQEREVASSPNEPAPDAVASSGVPRVVADEGNVAIPQSGNVAVKTEIPVAVKESHAQAPDFIPDTAVSEAAPVAAEKVSQGPGAAHELDSAFKAETSGESITPENAPKVLRTISPEADAVRKLMAATNIATGKGPSPDAPSKVRDAYNAIADSVRRYAQKTFPAINRGDADAGDAAARLISSREVIHRQADALQSRVLEAMGAKPGDAADRKLGAVLAEDQLRGIRDKLYFMAKDPKATEEQRKEAGKAYTEVKTIIGAPDSPFKTKADYEAALTDPAIQSGLAAHRQFVEPTTEENYRLSAQLDPETELPARGRDTNSHISLKAIREEEPAFTQKGLKQGGNVANTLRKHSPFEKEAKGNANQYELKYSELVKNSIERGTLPASQARFYKALEDGGLAVTGKAGQSPTIDGRPTTAFDLQFKPGEKLYVRNDVAKEVRLALNIDKPENPFSVAGTHVSDIFNQIALLSGVEGISHGANHFAVLYKSQLAPEHVPAWLDKVPAVGKVASILDAVGTNAYRMLTGDIRAKESLAELAKLGALKPEYEGLGGGEMSKWNPTKYMGKVIDHLATASRLALDDGFRKGVDAGVFKDTPQNRRDYLNQLGQYHKEAQAGLVRIFRNIGLGPFATAGSTFYSQAVRTLGASPGVHATTSANAAKARLYVAAQLGGTLAMIGTLNYLRTGQLQPAGTPWGSLYLKTNDKEQPVYLDVADIIGAKRATRTIGLDAAIEGSRNGLTATAMADKALRQAEGSAVSPFMGPFPTAGMVALTGYTPHGLYDEAGRAKKGESQQVKNLVAAAKELNPTVGMALEGHERGLSGTQQVAQQLGKFGPRTGKNADELARMSQPQRIQDIVDAVRGGKSNKMVEDAANKGLITRTEATGIYQRLRFVDDEAASFYGLDPEKAVKAIEGMDAKNRGRPLYPSTKYSYAERAKDAVMKSRSLTDKQRKDLLNRLSQLK